MFFQLFSKKMKKIKELCKKWRILYKIYVKTEQPEVCIGGPDEYY